MPLKYFFSQKNLYVLYGSKNLFGLILLAFDVHSDDLESRIIFLEMKGKAEGL